MIITFSSIGGSPGVTSWAVLLAAAWPAEVDTERVVLEADLDGAVMGARFGIGIEPGASTLVSSARSADNSTLVIEEYGRRVDPLVWLVPGPESAEAARQLWSIPSAAENVATAAASDSRVWFVDVGRARPGGPLTPFFERSTMTVVVSRAEHESLVQVPARVAALKQSCSSVGVLVVGKPTFAQAELQQFFDVPSTRIVESSPDLVSASLRVWSERRVRRSQLWRSAVAVAAETADLVWLHADTEARQQREVAHGD